MRTAPLVALTALIAASAAVAADVVAAPPTTAAPFVGEVLEWSVHYGGIHAGSAWASTSDNGDGTLRLEAGCRSAPWYERIYMIDDLVTSTWAPGAGSLRYETRFREGGFQQDQVMRLSGTAVEVWRRQLVDGAWRESTTPYTTSDGAEDPVSAIYAMRLAAQDPTWTTPIFTGKKTSPLVVRRVGTDHLEDTPLGDLAVDVFDLRTSHQGDVEQKGDFRVYLSQDSRRVPLRVVVRTNVGPVRADLVNYQGPAA